MRCGIQALVWLLLVGAVVQPARAGVCDADLNHDGTVNTLDLGILLSSWTLPPARVCAGPACSADINGDGAVNTLDLGQLLVAWDAKCPPPAPHVVITPVAHSGDPAPGIDWPNAYYGVLLTPQIDGVGNVLFKCFLGGTGLGELGNQAIFYGQPGRISKLVWETDHAPHFPPGVIIKDLFFDDDRLCEAGIVSFAAILQGPGITPHVNDMAIFVGDPRIPGDIRPILQTGDQAPSLEPGVTVRDNPAYTFFNSEQSDNGTLLVFSRLAGPGVTMANDYAFWTGTRDSLQLVWRNGMHAPGTPPGVTFTWADNFSINDSGQIAIRGNVTGPGIIDGITDRGRWIGGPGALQVFAWPTLPAPDLPIGTTIAAMEDGITSLNSSGDMYTLVAIQGPDVTAQNEKALFAGASGKMDLIIREGNPVPQAGPGVEIDLMGNAFLNEQRNIFFTVRLRGDSIDDTNRWAAYFGPYDGPSVILHDSDPAPYFPAGTVLLNTAIGSVALNDVGDVVTITEIAGPGVTADTDTVLWMHHSGIGSWFPLLRGGQVIDGQVVNLPDYTFLLSGYWQETGGSDGFGLSFNDAGQLVSKIKFTDGSHGIYVLHAVTQDQ